jgi:hypothetical protein
MNEASPTVCEVVGCARVPVGTYLHIVDGPAQHFAICEVHLARMRSGHRPTVVAERLDLADLGTRPALLFE